MFCFFNIYLYGIRRKYKGCLVQWPDLSAIPLPWEHQVGLAHIILSLLLLPWGQSRERALPLHFLLKMPRATLPCNWLLTRHVQSSRWICNPALLELVVLPLGWVWKVLWSLMCPAEDLLSAPAAVGLGVPSSSRAEIPVPVCAPTLWFLPGLCTHKGNEVTLCLLSQLLRIWSDIEVLCRIEMEVLNKRGLFAADCISFQPAAGWNSIFMFTVYFLKWT